MTQSRFAGLTATVNGGACPAKRTTHLRRVSGRSLMRVFFYFQEKSSDDPQEDNYDGID